MAQKYQTADGTVLVDPGGYVNIAVQPSVGGAAINGVLFLVGEANGGPDYTLETDLTRNWFGPDQDSLVRAKYGTGRLVEAFLAAAVPSADEKLTGSPTRIYLIKTNPSVKAYKTIANFAAGTYHTLADRGYGDLGNMLYFSISEETPETIPTTGSFTLLIPNNTTDISFRTNGGSSLTYQFTAADLPPTTVTGIAALTGILATGGTNRSILTVAGTVALAAVGNVVTITRSVAWAVTPTVGDSLYIPSGSVIQGATNKNRGSYVITAATSTVITATKLLDSTGAAGAVTAPETVAATNAAAVTDVMAFAPVVITQETADPSDGIGKSLEINELTSSTGRLSDLCYTLNTTQATWVSKTGVPKILTSSSEYSVQIDVGRQYDSVSESTTAGGQIALLIGYAGTTATLTISSTTLITSVTGGSGENLSVSLKSLVTIADLAGYINTKTGYTCSVGTTALGQKLSTALDRVSAAGICSTFGNPTGRVKIDATVFFDAVQQNLGHVQLGTTTALNVRAAAGLPDTSTTQYLTSGALGATTDAIYQGAVDALQKLRGNFVIPLFSQDAADDITEGLTSSSSTYTIAAINAYTKTHVLAMSQPKRRRHRQAFLSLEDSFSVVQVAATNLASGRVSLTFQDIIHTSVDAGLVRQQPWLGAVLAAGMQAAAYSKGIVHRTPNQSGVLSKDGSFDASNGTSIETALLAGLLPIKTDESVTYWASDQTTYIRDANFYHNSIQAVYVGDQLGQKLAADAERALVGESVADVTAPMALNVIKAILRDALRTKLIAPDDEAPEGYRNLRVKVANGAVTVKVECKLAGLIYFAVIDLLVSLASSTATG